jgi:tetratricopeptide (TPR) repeat protein
MGFATALPILRLLGRPFGTPETLIERLTMKKLLLLSMLCIVITLWGYMPPQKATARVTAESLRELPYSQQPMPGPKTPSAGSRASGAASAMAQTEKTPGLDRAKGAPAADGRPLVEIRPVEVEPMEVVRLNSEIRKLYGQGKYDEAIPLAERALAIREKAFGPEHPKVAEALNNFGLLYRTKGDYARAEPLHQRALAISEKAQGPEHPDVAEALTKLAILYQTKGDYARVEPLYQRALAIREKILGPEHPDVALDLNNLAALRWWMKRGSTSSSATA